MSRALDSSDEADRLLPGEDPHSALPDDVAHWIRVYVELCTTKGRMIENLHLLMEPRSPDARDELARTDVPALDEELKRFQRRLAYWQRRQADLEQEEPVEDSPRTRL